MRKARSTWAQSTDIPTKIVKAMASMMPIGQASDHVISDASRALIQTTHASTRPVCTTARVSRSTHAKQAATEMPAAAREPVTMFVSRLAMTSCDEASNALPTPAGRPLARSSR